MLGFRWFKKVAEYFERVQKTPIMDPWEGCDDITYIYHFRRELEEVAKSLSFEGGLSQVYTRFNYYKVCVELYTREKGVIAQVNVHGSEGCPYLAIVRCNLPIKSKGLFSKILNGVTVEFETLAFAQ